MCHKRKRKGASNKAAKKRASPVTLLPSVSFDNQKEFWKLIQWQECQRVMKGGQPLAIPHSKTLPFSRSTKRKLLRMCGIVSKDWEKHPFLSANRTEIRLWKSSIDDPCLITKNAEAQAAYGFIFSTFMTHIQATVGDNVSLMSFKVTARGGHCMRSKIVQTAHHDTLRPGCFLTDAAQLSMLQYTSNHRIVIPILQGVKQTLGAEACEEEGIDVEHDGTEVRFCFVLNAKPEEGSDLIYESKITGTTVSISTYSWNILVSHTVVMSDYGSGSGNLRPHTLEQHDAYSCSWHEWRL